MADTDLNIWVKTKDQASQGLGNIERKSGGFFRRMRAGWVGLAAKVFIYTAAIKAAGRAISTFTGAASKVENLQTRLKVLFGSVEQGNRVFADMEKLAGRVPKTYDEIMESATNLAAVVKGGPEEVKKLMPIIVDLSSATGISVRDTTSQIIRMYSAGAAAADMFRERGVLAMLGFKAGVSVSAEETMDRVVAAWEDANSKFRGASQELANTWTGQMSMLEDAWFKFTSSFGEFITQSGAAKDGIDSLREATKFYAEAAERAKKAQEALGRTELEKDLKRQLVPIEKALRILEEQGNAQLALNGRITDYHTLLIERERILATLDRINEDLTESQGNLNDETQRGVDIWASFRQGAKQGIESSRDEYGDFIGSIKTGTVNLVDSLQGTLTEFFDDFLRGKVKDAGDLFRSFGNSVLKILSSVLANLALFGFSGSGGLIGGFFSKGASTAASTAASSTAGAVGAGVRPYQFGTKHVPETGLYMLHRGEEVRTPGQQGGGGGGQTINYFIAAMDSQSFHEFLLRNKGSVHQIVSDNLRYRGSLANQIRTK